MIQSFLGKETITVDHRHGKIGWRSPSNIALVKYWGKHGDQLPQNPSISFTLNNAFTETIMEYEVQDYTSDQVMIDFYFEGQPNLAFQRKIQTFLNKKIDYFPFIKRLHLSIDSYNSFPHSSGIASSASSMSALCLCLTTLEERLTDQHFSLASFNQKSSFLSRLASGSASRSVYPSAAIWGKNTNVPDTSDLFAIPFDRLHKNFAQYHDDILIISKEEKKVSSTAGHKLMEGNRYADVRYRQANEHFLSLISILEKGDLEAFGQIVEDEALTLHALMMSSHPSYILMEPNTLLAIQRIKAFRNDTNLPVYFTLDAGPNIHLLYPDNIKKEVADFIQQELIDLCENKTIIYDQIGNGPVEIHTFSLNKKE